MPHHVISCSRLIRCWSGPQDGGQYDMSAACQQCGTGAIRKDPLFIAPSMCKDGVAATYKLQTLVSQRLYNALCNLGVSGLRQAIHKKTKDPIPFWSLEPTATLPPWSEASCGFCTSEMDPSCSACRRDGFFNATKKPLLLVYDSSAAPLFQANDVLATWEHFGKSRLRGPFSESIFAVPRLIVSDRVKAALESERGVEFIPVTVNEV